MGCTPSQLADAAASHPRDAVLMISSDDHKSPSTTTLGSDSPASINESPAVNEENQVKIESSALFSADDCDKEQQLNKENENEEDEEEEDRDVSDPKTAYPSPRSYYANERQGSVVNRNAAFLSLLQSTQPSWRA
jgi:hypothetical protein